MGRENQSTRRVQPKALGAGAPSACETDSKVVVSEPNRDNNRVRARTGESASHQVKDIGRLTLVPVAALRPDPRNPRKHSRVQVRAIARSIEAFGFNAPILVDKRNQIVAGHGRYEAAQLLGLESIPIISLDHLTEAQARAYLLADNKLAER
jgi:hypothetical protein